MKITVEQIQDELNPNGWSLLSETYQNLTSELIFECPYGHRVYSTWGKMRGHQHCPVCENNSKFTDTNIIPKPKGARRVLALDQATHTSGWAIYDDDKLVKYGTFTTSYEDNIQRSNQVKVWLLSMIRNWRPDHVGLENIQFQEEGGGRKMGVTVFQTLAQLQGILMEACYENNVPFMLCATNTWRHFCGVKGSTRTDKKRSMQMLAKKWHQVDVSEDEADAIGIGKYVAAQINVKVEVEDWE